MVYRDQLSSKRRSTRWRLLSRCGFAVLLQSAATHPTAGQAIPKPEYVTYLPREIVLPVQATPANRQFHLFGDSTTPGYRDEAPRDGIDDTRERWLRALAVRFSPWMAELGRFPDGLPAVRGGR